MSASDPSFGIGAIGLILLACSSPRNSLGVTSGAAKSTAAPIAEQTAAADAIAPKPPLQRISVAAPEPDLPVEELPPFPSDITLYSPQDVPIGGDRDLRVAHAPEGVHGAVIYLHGMCGNPEGADPWIDLVTEHATVITVRANIKCPDRPGYKWPQEPEEIQPRIDAALRKVRELRSGYLNIDEVTLIGYSQGSHRGEKLAAAFPEKYPDLVLGGPPTAPQPELLKKARSVAILGGELEDTTHMEAGFANLQTAGIRSRFFLLPRAHHGSYGPEGRRVMSEVLSWLWETPQ